MHSDKDAGSDRGMHFSWFYIDRRVDGGGLATHFIAGIWRAYDVVRN